MAHGGASGEGLAGGGPGSAGGRERVARQILNEATATASTPDFLRRVLQTLLEFAGCEAAELCLRQGSGWLRSRVARGEAGAVSFVMGASHEGEHGQESPGHPGEHSIERVVQELSCAASQSAQPGAGPSGAFRVGDLSAPRDAPGAGVLQAYVRDVCLPDGYRSAAVIALKGAVEPVGLLHLMSRRPESLTTEQMGHCEDLAGTLAAAVVSQRALAALRERVKELTCLYEISHVADRPGASLETVLHGIVELLPPAWQYPEAAQARIVLDGRSYATQGYRGGPQKQSADIVVNGALRGSVEVTYAEQKPDLDEGPFLAEERKLIDAVAREVALIIERRLVQEEQARLRDQLMHADRLATIGQLAAGVAHELNEPLGNVLGFGQLAQKCPGLPPQAARDLGKIVAIALDAREVIRKLLLFARQAPSKRAPVDLNAIVTNGLSFFEGRCAAAGIQVHLILEPELPEIVADPAQMNQVLVNLVVNAVQAMPDGGELTVRTSAPGGCVTLSVQDTGVGMSEETLKQIFLPFFTTKDVGEGTGLGLPVVHGIVSAHGGRVGVESEVGRGSRFEVRFPPGTSEEAEEGH